MLKKLRRKFIVTTLLAVVLILTAIMVTVNVVNYVAVIKSTDEVVDLLIHNDGRFPQEFRNADAPNQQENEQKPDFPEGFSPQKGDVFNLPNDMSMETPFDTRFFVVNVQEGEVKSIDLNRIAAVDEKQAEEMAKKVVSKSAESGVTGVYRYRIKTLDDGSKMIVFVDISRQLEPMISFLRISLIVMAVCIILFFIGVFLLSKPILRPITESYTRQKRFITDAGHELKTPLTIISANNEIQEMETGETECTQAISKQVSRMTTMVKNLTELARMDEEESFSKKTFDLSGAFHDVTHTFENVYAKYNKKLTIKCRDNITYFGTEALIRRLFTLLMENASKYSLTYTDAELIKKGKQIVLTVKNDAEGITEGSQNKCFERFYRSEEARASKTEGSGIGLSTAQEIVRLHRGKISAEGTKNGEFIIKVIL